MLSHKRMDFLFKTAIATFAIPIHTNDIVTASNLGTKDVVNRDHQLLANAAMFVVFVIMSFLEPSDHYDSELPSPEATLET